MKKKDYNNELLNDCASFADKHRDKNKTSGPHWPVILRFPKLFDEAARLQQRVDTLEAYINDYCGKPSEDKVSMTQTITISDPPKSWWPGCAQVEEYMPSVAEAIKRHIKYPSPEFTDIYNRAYQAIFNVMVAKYDYIGSLEDRIAELESAQ